MTGSVPCYFVLHSSRFRRKTKSKNNHDFHLLLDHSLYTTIEKEAYLHEHRGKYIFFYILWIRVIQMAREAATKQMSKEVRKYAALFSSPSLYLSTLSAIFRSRPARYKLEESTCIKRVKIHPRYSLDYEEGVCGKK